MVSAGERGPRDWEPIGRAAFATPRRHTAANAAGCVGVTGGERIHRWSHPLAAFLAVAVALVAAATVVRLGSARPLTPAVEHRPPDVRTGYAAPRRAAPSFDRIARGSRVAIGVSVTGSPRAALIDFAQAVGVRPKIAMWYSNGVSRCSIGAQTEAAASVGVRVMISWEPTRNGAGVPLAAIVNGKYDAYLRASPERLLSTGGRCTSALRPR